jgi:hypothetical protein
MVSNLCFMMSVVFGRFMPCDLSSKNGLPLPFLLARRPVWTSIALSLVALVARDFIVGTTFLGDDYVFRAFARLETNPFVAFVTDKHGGEYYRPIPMLLWWALERIGGGTVWPFASAAFALHATCAALLALVAHRLGASLRAVFLAGTLFFVAPAEREAALWFSASTDLVAAAAMLGSLACLLSRRRALRVVSVGLAAVAYFSKETALAFPFLVASVLWYLQPPSDRHGRSRLWRIGTRLVPYCAAGAGYLLARSLVLHGIGGNNDPRAPSWALAIQIVGGWAHAVSAYAPLPEWAALLAGALALAAAAFALRRSRLAILAGLWAGLAVVLLPAAGWVVGARYFYFSAAGLMLLLALALERARPWLSVAAVVVLAGLGAVAAHRRSSEIRLYRQVVSAAGQAVADGAAKGDHLFLVRGAVKDLDLAIKLDAGAPDVLAGVVAIPDVPASFVWLPARLAERLSFLLAEPPLPPSGAYRFGSERIVGLARREEAPDFDEVLARLPDLRIIRLKRDSRPVSWEAVTRE